MNKFNPNIFLTLITLAFFLFMIFKIVNKVKEIKKIKSEQAERRKNIDILYERFKSSHGELKDFFDRLEVIIQESIKSKDTTQKDKNQILFAYNFYIDAIEQIKSNKKVSDNDMIYLAEIHIKYIEIVKENRKAKNKKAMEIANKFFSLN